MADDLDELLEDEPVSAPSKRERSTIEFPYSDIMAAQHLTRILYERGGGSASPRQLAGWMDQSATGGTFRTRLSAARLFGFVETDRNAVSITALGRDAIDDRQWQGAFVTGFQNVPLFRKMYEKHEGYALPPAPAIERQMVELGVSGKQADRARQTFVSSATSAGFIDPQTSRLVQPRVHMSLVLTNEPIAEDKAPTLHRGSLSRHPFIEGLLETLPDQDKFTDWQIEEQAEWLNAAVGIFKLLSKAKGRIVVTVQPDKMTAADQ